MRLPASVVTDEDRRSAGPGTWFAGGRELSPAISLSTQSREERGPRSTLLSWEA